jgi:ribosome-binding factor A
MQAVSGHKRSTQVGELLREKISIILLHKSRDPRLHDLTVTGVELTDDLRRARVFYLTRGELKDLSEIQTALDKASGFIKQELAREHILRVIPDIFFCHDEAWQRGERIDYLLRDLKKQTPEPGGSQEST